MPSEHIPRFDIAALITGLYAIFFGIWWQSFNDIVFDLKGQQVRSHVSLVVPVLQGFLVFFTLLFMLGFVTFLTMWIIRTINLPFRQTHGDVILLYVFLFSFLLLSNVFLRDVEVRSLIGALMLTGWIATTYGFVVVYRPGSPI